MLAHFELNESCHSKCRYICFGDIFKQDLSYYAETYLLIKQINPNGIPRSDILLPKVESYSRREINLG